MPDPRSFVREPTEHDWPEDARFENGNYQNRCCACSTMFIGYKRRYFCRKCSTEGERIA